MIVDGITESNSVEALVLSVQGQVSGIASQYSSSWPVLSYDDLVGIGMAEVVKAARLTLPANAKVAHSTLAHKRAYLTRAARFAIMAQYRDGYGDPMARPAKISSSPLVSLDAPLGSASRLSQYDVLAFVDPVISGDRNFAPLYDAVASLPEINREAICMRFGLCGYGEHRVCEIASLLQISQSAVCGRIKSGLALLREHTELLSLVGGAGGDYAPSCYPMAGQRVEELLVEGDKDLSEEDRRYVTIVPVAPLVIDDGDGQSIYEEVQG